MSNTDDGIVEKVARAICREEYVMHDEPERSRCVDEDSHAYMDHAKAAIAAYESHLRDKGMVVVPAEPTSAMIEANRDAPYSMSFTDQVRNDWQAMIAASPRP